MKTGFVKWLKRLFLEDDGDSRVIDMTAYQAKKEQVYINTYAIFTVIDFVSTLMSKIEYQTLYEDKIKKGMEWHRLNVKPNVNQNAAQFWKEIWAKLLYYQEVLVVEIGNQLIIADNFSHHPEFAIAEDYFENVSRGNMTFNRKWNRSDVIYLEYSNFNVTNLVHGVLDMYSDLLSASVGQFKKNGGEKGILDVSMAATGPKDFEEKYGEYMNKRFKSYFDARNAIMPLFKNMKYTGKELTGGAAADDINKLSDDAMAAACRAYKVPYSLLKGEVAGMSDAFDVLLTTCIDPLANMAAKELSGNQFTPQQTAAGSRICAFTNNIKHTDIFDNATQYDKLFACGFSHNTLNALLDLPQVDEEWANAHHITKNYSDAKEGGENNESK